jgi:hypothetical protein
MNQSGDDVLTETLAWPPKKRPPQAVAKRNAAKRRTGANITALPQGSASPYAPQGEGEHGRNTYSNFRFYSPFTASQARLWTMSGRDSQANPGIAV